MRTIKRLFFSSIQLAVFLQTALFAQIVQIDNLNEASPIFFQSDANTLVLFDVDFTLLVPNDAILRPCGELLARKFTKEILQNPLIIPPGTYSEGYLFSQTLLQAKSSLVDENFLPLINWLQHQNIRTIAFTAAPSGKLGAIVNMADWRIEQLKSFGIDFTMAFPELGVIKLPKREDKIFTPLFKSGILFSSKHPKGEVLKQFLNTIQLSPLKVIFIDDKLFYLQSVAKAMEEMGIEFIGIYYLAAGKLPCDLNEKIGEFQFTYLAEHAVWLSDREAEHMQNQVD